MKEAYTKALGIGLGFDFRRIEYNVPQEQVTVDGVALKGWHFQTFDLVDEEDYYQGVVAEFVGGDEPSLLHRLREDSIGRFQADTFVRKAIDELQ